MLRAGGIHGNCSSAATPNGNVAGTSTALADETDYGAMLHEALTPQNTHVKQLTIPDAIGGGDPLYAPDALADRLWNIHARPGPFRPGPFRTTVGAESA